MPEGIAILIITSAHAAEKLTDEACLKKCFETDSVAFKELVIGTLSLIQHLNVRILPQIRSGSRS